MFKRFKINRCQLNYKNRCDEQTGGFYMNVKSIDIARALGISKSTVSLALNGKPGVSEQTRQEVLACKKQLEEHGVVPPGMFSRQPEQRKR